MPQAVQDIARLVRLPLPAEAPMLVLAVTLPALLAFNLPPSSTMLNQCLAVGLWAGVVAVGSQTLAWRGAHPLQAAVVALLAALLAATALGGFPGTLALGTVGVLLAAGLVVAHAASAAQRTDGPAGAFVPFAVGLATAAVLSTLVALIQVFAPAAWSDGDLIARSGLVGRAVGNLRQPNHLCSLLLWGVIAVVALLEMRRLSLKWAVALVVPMVFAVELSASRGGALGLALLFLWGALDRRLSRGARLLLLATPIIYGLSYGAMSLYGQWADQAFGAEARLATGEATAESPNSRKRIWANALTLIAQQPITGVGFGEFNIAWSLTAFPGRPIAFFDHTHNLPLQIAVELGLPLAALVLGLLGFALYRAWKNSGQATGDAGTAARAGFMLVLMIGFHSLFEYPLWYAYFLLPTAFAWGFALGTGPAPDAAAPATPATATLSPDAAWSARLGRVFGILLVAGAVFALTDYLRIASIYSPGANAAPLNERIARGQRSPLFGHHADYAAATSPDPLPGRDLAFRRATHHLLDTRLMMAWAEYLAEQGKLDEARWLSQRLREFRNPASDDFFAACDRTDVSEDALPFQCKPPEQDHSWREFAQR